VVASEELAASAQEAKAEARVVGETESYESTDGPRERHISNGQKHRPFGAGDLWSSSSRKRTPRDWHDDRRQFAEKPRKPSGERGGRAYSTVRDVREGMPGASRSSEAFGSLKRCG